METENLTVPEAIDLLEHLAYHCGDMDLKQKINDIEEAVYSGEVNLPE